jgi:membrane-bound metal-dependent hydrolase YbcI (DUF457 family)
VITLNGAAHFGFGVLFYLLTVKLFGYTPTYTEVLLAGIMGLLCDVDMAIMYVRKVEHRKYTHTFVGTFILSLVGFGIGYLFSLPTAFGFAAAVFSHYLADFVYADWFGKIIKIPENSPVNSYEYIGTAVLSFIALYALVIEYLESEWLIISSWITLGLITIVAIIMKKKR